MKRTGATNPILKELISELRKASIDKDLKICKSIALNLEKPSRQRRIVNLSKINRFTKENDIIVVPGKVLGSGCLDHKLTISAFQFSDNAIKKINEAGAKHVPLSEFIREDIKGKRVRIIG